MSSRIGGAFTVDECREIVRGAIAMGTMSYPGGGTEPPVVEEWVPVTVQRARSAGISVEEYLSKERVKDRARRAERLLYRKKCLEKEKVEA